MVIFSSVLHILVFVSLVMVLKNFRLIKPIFTKNLKLVTILSMVQIVFSLLDEFTDIGIIERCSHSMINFIFLGYMGLFFRLLKIKYYKNKTIARFISAIIVIDSVLYIISPNYYGENFLVLHQCLIISLTLILVMTLVLKYSQVTFLYGLNFLFFAFYLSVCCWFSEFCEHSQSLKLPVNINELMLSFSPFIVAFMGRPVRSKFMQGLIRSRVFDELGLAIVVFDTEEMLVDCNESANRLFSLEYYRRTNISLTEFLTNCLNGQLRKRSNNAYEEVMLKTAFGEERYYGMDYKIFKSDDSKNFSTILFFQDITEQKKLFKNMESVAMTDLETGLPVEALLLQKVKEINLFRKFPYTCAVIKINGLDIIKQCFDFDGMKAVEVHASEILKEQLRSSDFAYYKDQSFVVLFPDSDKGSAELFCKRLSDKIESNNPFMLPLTIEYSIIERETKDTDMREVLSRCENEVKQKLLLSENTVKSTFVENLKTKLRQSSFETAEHSERVVVLAKKLGSKLGLSEEEIEKLNLLSLFHDIGELSIPEEILLKPDDLNDEERQMVERHALYGYQIAKITSELGVISNEILCHHERWDGKGYPNGYVKKQIPLLSRILSICDAWDVMTHDKFYRSAKSRQEAINELKFQRGKQFDPEIIDEFLKIIEE